MVKLKWLNGKASESQRGGLLLPAWGFPTQAMTRVLLGLVAIASVSSFQMPAIAVERVTVKIGSVEKSVAIADIDRFAKTGEVSDDLKPFSFVLTSDVQRVFGERLELEPEQADQLIDNLLKSSAGERILKAVDLVFPGTSIEQIQIALMLAARQANGVSIPSVLRALPGENVTVDLSALIVAVSTIKFPPLETTSPDSSQQQQFVTSE